MTTPTAPTMRLYRSRRASHHLIYSRLVYGAAVVVSDDMQQVCDQRCGPVHPRTVALWPAFRTSDAWFNCCQQVKSLIEFEHAQKKRTALATRFQPCEFLGATCDIVSHSSPPARNGAHNRHTGC